MLIISEFMKSLWFLLYEIVSIAPRRLLKSSSTFCQVDGFFFATSIEASDAALFLLVLHSTVYIFWPNRTGGDSGLYPYRRGAYAFFALWPILMASLAFVTGTSAYVNTGQYCYLPTKPWWYRTALSWIPRYINLTLILLMYGSSYMYIRVMMNRYGRRNSEVPVGHTDMTAPLTPSSTTHGLISSTSTGSGPSYSRTTSTAKVYKERAPSRTAKHLKARARFRLMLDRLNPRTHSRDYRAWTGFESGDLQRPDPLSAPISPCGGTLFADPADIGPLPATAGVTQASVGLPKLAFLERKLPMDTTEPSDSLTAPELVRYNRYQRVQANHADAGNGVTGAAQVGHHQAHRCSQVHIQSILQEGPRRLSEAGSRLSLPIVALDQATFESGGITRSRQRLRRQLRSLFVYPAVYTCIWLFPFVNDLAIFNRSVQKHAPPWLALCSLVSLSIQGLANSVLFCAREKPWRQLRGGFWESLGLDFLKGWSCSLRKDSGRTREEMFNDGQQARSRRDEELELEQEILRGPEVRRPVRAGSKNWWDADLAIAAQGRGGSQGGRASNC